MKGSAGIPILRLEVLRAAISKGPKAPTGFFRGLIPSFNNDSDAIKWEIEYGSGGMSPFVAPGSVAPTIGMDGVGEGSAKAAYWKEKIFFGEEFLNNLRAVGTYQTKERAERQVAKGLVKLRNRMERRKEWMCSQMFLNGAISYTDTKGMSFSVSYGVPDTHVVTLPADEKWGNDGGANRNPLEVVFNGKQTVKDDSGADVEYGLCTTQLVRDLMFDKNIQSLLTKSNFGNGDLFTNPVSVLGSLLNIQLKVYDEFYEIEGWITTNTSGTTIYLDDVTDFAVGGTARFINMNSTRSWEDRVITAVSVSAGTITIASSLTNTYKAGRDRVVMKKKFLDDNKFVMMSTRVDGVPVAEFLNAPHEVPAAYGLQPRTWDENDPNGTWIMLADKGFPIYSNPDTTYIVTVKD